MKEQSRKRIRAITTEIREAPSSTTPRIISRRYLGKNPAGYCGPRRPACPARLESSPRRDPLDKWLWAARFFKTRSRAQQAVAAGRVKVNANAVKPARELRVGDGVSDSRENLLAGAYVKNLSEKRQGRPKKRENCMRKTKRAASSGGEPASNRRFADTKGGDSAVFMADSAAQGVHAALPLDAAPRLITVLLRFSAGRRFCGQVLERNAPVKRFSLDRNPSPTLSSRPA